MNAKNEFDGDGFELTSVDRYSPNSLGRLLGRVNSTVFKDETGEVEYYGHRVLLIRKGIFHRLEEELQKRHAVGTGRIILSILGRSEGHEEGKSLMNDVILDSADRRSIPTFVKNALEETNLGYGKMKLGDLDVSSKTVTISTQNSLEAEVTTTALDNGCFFLMGYLEGFFSELLGTTLTATESSCKGRGDNACVFHVSPAPPPSKIRL